jgi:hypothetical protein
VGRAATHVEHRRQELRFGNDGPEVERGVDADDVRLWSGDELRQRRRAIPSRSAYSGLLAGQDPGYQ